MKKRILRATLLMLTAALLGIGLYACGGGGGGGTTSMTAGATLSGNGQ